MRIGKIFLMAAALLQMLDARAADELTDAMQAAYAPYRVALFRTNSKAQAESEQAIASARQSWQAFADRFSARRPSPYDRDGAFAAALTQVNTIYSRADQQIRERQLAQAHETLEEARDVMAQLRRRNGVITYSDHMNAYHAEMEHIIGAGAGAGAGAPNAAMVLMGQVGVLEYLARRLRSEAPPAVGSDPEFNAMVQAVESSVSALRAAVLSQDPAAIRQGIDRLKAPYSRMFLKFG